jgi:flavin reductase (DIM6/NTAB) family NADH-FMN oxidoreductase RutF
MSAAHRTLDPAAMQPADVYKLLTGTVVPRPIAFVASRDENGVLNLAPFSFFMVASANPPVLCFSASAREAKDGLAPYKDTLANVQATGEFVVNIVSDEIVEAMNQTAAQVPPEVDEFALAGLTPVPSEVVGVPRVGEAKVQMECRLWKVMPVGEQPVSSTLVFGQVLRFHVSEAVLGERFHVDSQELRAVGRMAGAEYVHTLDRFELQRPK